MYCDVNSLQKDLLEKTVLLKHCKVFERGYTLS